MVRTAAVSPAAREASVAAPVVDAADVEARSVQRTRRINADIVWVANVCETSAQALNETVDRLTMARHEQAELLLEEQQMEVDEADALELIRAQNAAEEMAAEEEDAKLDAVDHTATMHSDDVGVSDDDETDAYPIESACYRGAFGHEDTEDEIDGLFAPVDHATPVQRQNTTQPAMDDSIVHASRAASLLNALSPMDVNKSTRKPVVAVAPMASPARMSSPGAFSPAGGLSERAASVAVAAVEERVSMMRDYFNDDVSFRQGTDGDNEESFTF